MPKPKITASVLAITLIAIPPTSGADGEKERMLELINSTRRGYQLHSLATSQYLDYIASAAAYYQSTQGYENYLESCNKGNCIPHLQHLWYDAEGSSVNSSGRAKYVGMESHTVRENAWIDAGSVDNAHSEFMNSPIHRDLILADWTNCVGIGIARNPYTDRLTVVVDFSN